MTWPEVIQQYLAELRARQLAPRTVANDGRRVTEFRAYCERQSVLLLSQLRPAHFRGFVRELRGRGLNATTFYNWLGAVRRWLKWATHRDHLVDNPAADWEPRHPPASIR